MESTDVVVIGAGVVGIACARALALAGREVLLLECEKGFGTGVSSRNSEVIHAGLYYPNGSSKARHCVAGRQLLYDYCTQRGIPFRRCGKLLVATEANQGAQIDKLLANAAAMTAFRLFAERHADDELEQQPIRCGSQPPSQSEVDVPAMN